MSKSPVAMKEIENAVTALRMQGAGKFRLKDVLDQLPGANEETGERLERLLDSDGEYFSDGIGNYTGRAEFFTGGYFLITPDGNEIEQGILYPGHRFSAVLSPDIFPADVRFREKGHRKCCVSRTITGTLSEIFHYHLLLGSEQVFDYLIAEHPDNVVLRQNPGPTQKVTLNVFDLAEFYRKNDFTEGDALLCRVNDWREGVVTFSYLSGKDRKARAESAWCNDFTDALEEIIRRFEDYLDIPEQLAWGYFQGGKTLLDEPGASIDELIRMTERIEITFAAGHTVLALQQDEPEEPEEDAFWDGGEDHDDCDDEHCSCHHHDDLQQEVLRISKGETENFGKVLSDIGLCLTPIEVDSYILDCCFYRELEFDGFFDRCFGRDQLEFADEAQQAVFLNAVEERWESLSGNYDRVPDELKAPLRSAILEVLDSRIAFYNELRNAGTDPKSLPEEAFRKLITIGVYLDEVLRILNAPGHELEESEAAALEERIADLAEEQETLLNQLDVNLE
ncbi:MAG: hypothetical protein J6R85_05475 [Lentisphaeria bacterium]|nr:hypothetical protein [Lentisphaeria bacterium]